MCTSSPSLTDSSSSINSRSTVCYQVKSHKLRMPGGTGRDTSEHREEAAHCLPTHQPELVLCVWSESHTRENIRRCSICRTEQRRAWDLATLFPKKGWKGLCKGTAQVEIQSCFQMFSVRQTREPQNSIALEIRERQRIDR